MFDGDGKHRCMIMSVISMILIITLSVSIPLVEGGTRVKNSSRLSIPEDVMHHEKLDLPDTVTSIDLKVDSERQIDVYIIDNDNFTAHDIDGTDFENASYSMENVTELEVRWDVPDDEDYHLVLINYGEEETWVEYSYSYELEEDGFAEFIEDISILFPTFCCFFGLLIIGAFILLLILFVLILEDK